MSITFKADNVSVERYQRNFVQVSVEADGKEIAAQLDIDDRLYDLDPENIVEQVGWEKLLECMDANDVGKWLTENT